MSHPIAPSDLHRSDDLPGRSDDLHDLAPELIWLQERGIELRTLPGALIGRRSGDPPVLYLVPSDGTPPPCGAKEDWVRRPLRSSELVARADRLLALCHPAPPVTVALERNVLQIDGRVVVLSPQESLVLEVLLGGAGQLVTRDQIAARHVWPDRSPSDGRAVDNRIKSLRKRLAGQPVRIHTVHGRGLLLELLPAS